MLFGFSLMAQPSATDATNITTTSFNANWNTVSSATGYYLDVATDNAFTSMVTDYNNKDVSNVTTFDVTGLTAGTTYYYRVRSYDKSTTSSSSNTITVTTLKKDQTITFNTLNAVTYGHADFSLTATASSGLTVTYTSDNTNIATISGTTVHIVRAGICKITAHQAGNATYNAAPDKVQSLNVNQKELTVTEATVTTKVYDGNTDATITNGKLNGVINSDNVILTSGTGAFADKNVGTAKTVTSHYTTSGTDATNYFLTQPTGLTGTITAKELTVTGAKVDTKVYDGTTDATITNGALSGLISGDAVTLSNETGAFADKNVGTAKTVTSAFSITGTDVGNYTLAQPSLTGEITAKALTVTGAKVDTKVYDGTTDATITNGALSGLISGDAVTLSNETGTFADKNVGTSKTVTSAFSITGTDATNYFLTQPTGLTGTITAKAIKVTANAGQTKIYGATDPTFTYTSDPSLVSGDSFSGALTRESGENIGTYKILIGTLTAGTNYNITFVSANFEITANTDASLSTLTIDGNSISNFDPATFSYDTVLTNGTTVVPTVDATPTDTNATYKVNNATSLPGTTTVVVTAQDGTTQSTYSINFTVAATAINELNAKVNIYPNPAMEKLYITANENYTVDIFDMNGRNVAKTIMKNNKAIIDVSSLNAGVYSVRLSNENKSLLYNIIKK